MRCNGQRPAVVAHIEATEQHEMRRCGQPRRHAAASEACEDGARMFGSAPTAWIERLVRMPRSRRVYKPAMLLAALDAIDAGASAAHVPLDDLLDRFDDLLERSGLRGDTSKG